MNFQKFISYYNGKKFILEEDFPEVGAYLYVYQGNECINDYLQNNIEVCKEIASEKYNVPSNSWKLIEDGNPK